MWRLGRRLAHWLVEHFVPDGTIFLVGDETVDGHRGKKVFGKSRHRDAVRSSHSYTAFRYGHKWVVLAVLIRFPFTRRPWALPVLVVLYRSKDVLIQPEMERPHPRVILQLGRSLSHAKAPQELH